MGVQRGPSREGWLGALGPPLRSPHPHADPSPGGFPCPGKGAPTRLTPKEHPPHIPGRATSLQEAPHLPLRYRISLLSPPRSLPNSHSPSSTAPWRLPAAVGEMQVQQVPQVVEASSFHPPEGPVMESNRSVKLGSSNFSILAPALPQSTQEGGERKGLVPLYLGNCFRGSVP